jgi:cellulose synthase/poly-beta-1,6-N-acetylglucosamine synthase-like glycosyltransferase
VVNTDASVRIHPAALESLVARFGDPGVGVASGQDVSVGAAREQASGGESGYVGYEMRVRELETRVGGIVGASGCLYAIRADLHRLHVPDHLSRDFMAVLMARERGYRAVSVPEALCFVPRTSSLQHEFRRKVRTITRGMQTLLHNRRLLDPFRYGAFAWMLFSHKVCRWLVPWAALLAAAGLLLLAPAAPWARWALAAGFAGLVLAGCGWVWPAPRKLPAPVALAAYLVLGNLAACRAAVRALRGQGAPVWEPTRRERVDAPTATG